MILYYIWAWNKAQKNRDRDGDGDDGIAKNAEYYWNTYKHMFPTERELQ